MRLLVLLSLFVTLLVGVELELDKNYVGPKKLTVSQLGVSMGLPRDWEAVAKKGEGLLLFQKETKDTMVLRVKRFSISDAIVYLNEPHYLKNGIKVFPQEGIVKLNSRIYRRAYRSNTIQDRRSALIYVILGPQERAVVMKVYYDKANDSAIKATGMSIVQALSFTPTEQLQNALQDLEMRLQGIHVVYLKRDGGYDEKQELWLCSNRRYLLQVNRTVAGGMSRVHDQKTGIWSVEERQLILQGDDGFDRFINVETKDKALIFDSNRCYELHNTKCK
ncbi:MAG: hypothetical protein PF439_00740 [Helicobacteraceae bacterium]|jgi:hypothetical protein|nr:hypothetical protein [Helicobacteraceae bacterium]